MYDIKNLFTDSAAGHRTMVVAELSANHNQDFAIAVRTIEAAHKAGADAIKLQTYTPDTLTIDCSSQYFRIAHGTPWDGMTLYELYQKAFTPWEWHGELKRIANGLGLIFFASPFDRTAVDFLASLDVPAFKIASFEITDIPLVSYAASFRKPIFISTGIARLGDIDEAVAACRAQGNEQIVLLKCTSAYPTPIKAANLRTIPSLQHIFRLPVGLSDHTLGSTAAVVSVALGSCMIEKHFILDRGMGGPDATFSMEPAEFAAMVSLVREAELALGSSRVEPGEIAAQSVSLLARSLFVVENIEAGMPLTEHNIRSIRPGAGLHPRYLKEVLGKRARRALQKGTPLSWDLIE